MSAIREREDGPVWSMRRRVWHRVRLIGYGLIGPWLSKKEDGTVTLGWTACAATLVLAVMLARLVPLPSDGGGRTVSSVGWPEFMVVFVALYSKAINKAMTSLARLNPGKLVELVVSRFGQGGTVQQARPNVVARLQAAYPNAPTRAEDK